jgi:hypothetical protein
MFSGAKKQSWWKNQHSYKQKQKNPCQYNIICYSSARHGALHYLVLYNIASIIYVGARHGALHYLVLYNKW